MGEHHNTWLRLYRWRAKKKIAAKHGDVGREVAEGYVQVATMLSHGLKMNIASHDTLKQSKISHNTSLQTLHQICLSLH